MKSPVKQKMVKQAMDFMGQARMGAPMKPCFAGCQEACFIGQANKNEEGMNYPPGKRHPADTASPQGGEELIA
jgi:hypothetical protein